MGVAGEHGGRFRYLLASIVLLLVADPLLEERRWRALVVEVLLACLLVSGLRAVGGRGGPSGSPWPWPSPPLSWAGLATTERRGGPSPPRMPCS
jgi:hypothetical protein